jgi:hypothetical protein
VPVLLSVTVRLVVEAAPLLIAYAVTAGTVPSFSVIVSFTGADIPPARLPTFKYTVLVPLPADNVKVGAVE